jgi:hypothetical protein
MPKKAGQTDEQTVRDLDNILIATDSVRTNEELVAFARKTITRLTLLADLFCEAAEADPEDGHITLMSEEVEAAVRDHKNWKLGKDGP